MLDFANPCSHETTFAPVGVFEDDSMLLKLSERWTDSVAMSFSKRALSPGYEDEQRTTMPVEAAWDL